MQVRDEIFRKLVNAAWFLEQAEMQKTLSALNDASDNAYQQSGMEGFEDLEDVSDNINKIAEKIKTLTANS